MYLCQIMHHLGGKLYLVEMIEALGCTTALYSHWFKAVCDNTPLVGRYYRVDLLQQNNVITMIVIEEM